MNDQCSAISLGNGSRCNFTLLFAPTAVGQVSATLAVQSTSGAITTSQASGTGRDYVQLSIQIAGTGKGSVSCPNVTCQTGTPCSVSVERTDSTPFPQIDLVAKPDSSSQFSGWSGGNCSGTGTCSVTMDSAKVITANFDLRAAQPGLADVRAP